MGTWIGRKGIGTLISAAQGLDRQGIACRWLIAGTGVSEERVRNDWPYQLQECVEVVPRFAPNEEAAMLQRADLVVLPSFFEGQPLALLQAMEAGRCCIASRCCGQADFIEEGASGLLHAPGDAIELAALIERCLRDSALRAFLGRNARQRMSSRDWRSVSLEVAQWIENRFLLAKNS
jgi:glycosyltransferase involved in cell wall biosynthesis